MLWRSMKKMGRKCLILQIWSCREGVFFGRMVVVLVFGVVKNIVFSHLKVPPYSAKNWRKRSIVLWTVLFWLIPIDEGFLLIWNMLKFNSFPNLLISLYFILNFSFFLPISCNCILVKLRLSPSILSVFDKLVIDFWFVQLPLKWPLNF